METNNNKLEITYELRKYTEQKEMPISFEFLKKDIRYSRGI